MGLEPAPATQLQAEGASLARVPPSLDIKCRHKLKSANNVCLNLVRRYAVGSVLEAADEIAVEHHVQVRGQVVDKKLDSAAQQLLLCLAGLPGPLIRRVSIEPTARFRASKQENKAYRGNWAWKLEQTYWPDGPLRMGIKSARVRNAAVCARRTTRHLKTALLLPNSMLGQTRHTQN